MLFPKNTDTHFMAQVELRKLNKVYTDPQTKREVHAVKELDISIRDGEFLVLVGPSGCGKTTALRMIAGLEDISSGDIFIGERVVNDLPPGDRDIAMVFQNYALYPHMSVYDNLAFGLRLRLLPSLPQQLMQPAKARDIKADIDKRIQEAAELLDIKHLLDRKPKALSGGQRQRVALGRAIVRHPQVFLMDEPLSNLDAKLRVQTRAELIRLHRKLGVTTVYVTHDQAEAMTMGQRIAVMKDGVLQQCDAPLELYRHPVNLFVASFLGTPAMNFVPARVADLGSGSEGPTLDADSLRLRLPADRRDALQSYLGKDVTLGIRPEDIHAAGHVPPSVEHGEPARAQVDVIEAMGAESVFYLTAGRHTLIASVDAEVKGKEGAPMDIVIDSGTMHVFDVETELAIV